SLLLLQGRRDVRHRDRATSPAFPRLRRAARGAPTPSILVVFVTDALRSLLYYCIAIAKFPSFPVRKDLQGPVVHWAQIAPDAAGLNQCLQCKNPRCRVFSDCNYAKTRPDRRSPPTQRADQAVDHRGVPCLSA